ncbi:MAG: DnaJ domain-containing protein [Methanobrevibacter sp.]|jgi:DnaJ-class molecular chaperone|nr:DnaJ domain-containing protein [Methanobrevibacter sp.]
MYEECSSYDIFGIDEEFSQELIKKVYNKLIFTYHPGNVQLKGKENFRKKIYKIQEAYEDLINNT